MLSTAVVFWHDSGKPAGQVNALYVADGEVLELVELVATRLVLAIVVLVVTTIEVDEVLKEVLDGVLDDVLDEATLDAVVVVRVGEALGVMTISELDEPKEIVAVADIVVLGAALHFVPDLVADGAGHRRAKGLLIGRISRMPLMMPVDVVSVWGS